MHYSDAWLKKTAGLWDEMFLHYVDASIKKNAHDKASRMLTALAIEYLGLDKTKFRVRSNKAGVACSGEVTLHTEPLEGCDKGIYVQISQLSTMNSTVLYRTCFDLGDYVGHQNNFGSITKLMGTNADMQTFASQISRMCAAPSTPRYPSRV